MIGNETFKLTLEAAIAGCQAEDLRLTPVDARDIYDNK